MLELYWTSTRTWECYSISSRSNSSTACLWRRLHLDVPSPRCNWIFSSFSSWTFLNMLSRVLDLIFQPAGRSDPDGRAVWGPVTFWLVLKPKQFRFAYFVSFDVCITSLNEFSHRRSILVPWNDELWLLKHFMDLGRCHFALNLLAYICVGGT